ncbi:MAG: acylphosphatase [Rhodospirillales bacterium]
MTDGRASVRVQIEGRVQGVWYRAWTIREATARNIDGWVRNRSDGSVEALFCGPAAAVDEMVAQCRQGPPAAIVTRVTTTPAGPPAAPGFRQLPTA